MEAFANKTLAQIQDAIDEVEKAREDPALTAREKGTLEDISVSLRKMERTVTRKKEQELLKSLTEDSKELTKLSKEIKASAEHLSKLSVVLEKTSKVVGGLIKIIATALTAGLI